MGDDSVLLWLSFEVAWGYFIAVTFGVIGALQIVATQANRNDLRWRKTRSD